MLKVYRALAEDVNSVFDFCEKHNLDIEKEIPSVFIMKNGEDIIGICEYILNDSLDAAFIKEFFIADSYESQDLQEFLVKSVLNYLEMIKIYDVYVSFDDETYNEVYNDLRFKAMAVIDKSFNKYNKKYVYGVNLKGYFNSPCKSCAGSY